MSAFCNDETPGGDSGYPEMNCHADNDISSRNHVIVSSMDDWEQPNIINCFEV